jgi:hypothetical protein
MLSFSIPYRDLIKFPYFANTIERGDRGESRPKDRVALADNSIAFRSFWVEVQGNKNS